MILYVLSLVQILTAMDDVQKVQTLESLKWATETGPHGHLTIPAHCSVRPCGSYGNQVIGN